MMNALTQVLCGDRPAYIPAAPAYPSLFLADFERNYYIEQYRLRLRGQERYPLDHEEDTEPVEQALGLLEVVFPCDCVGEFDGQHAEIEHDAPGDLEKGGMGLPERNGKDDAPPDADIEGEADGDAGIAHQP